MSPAGDALARLPPIVPRFWIWTPPIVAARLRQAAENRVESRGDVAAVACVVSAPMRTPRRLAAIPRQASSRDRSITVRPSSVPRFQATIRSVPPASGSASGVASNRRTASRGERGLQHRHGFGGAAHVDDSGGPRLRGPGPDSRTASDDRFDDVLVPGTPAEISGEVFTDRVRVVRSAVTNPGPGGHQHARRADAALCRAGLEKRSLQSHAARPDRPATPPCEWTSRPPDRSE